jgi:hypothetical protein
MVVFTIQCQTNDQKRKFSNYILIKSIKIAKKIIKSILYASVHIWYQMANRKQKFLKLNPNKYIKNELKSAKNILPIVLWFYL